MNNVVIKAEKLGKMYTIGHQVERGRYTALRDVLMQSARSLWNKTKDLASGKLIIQGDTMEEVWALKDVNFEIKRGEAVGIIGRNGAGKSTLLKILSRITEPTTGRLTIRGRVASLLEVGTGFHPELSGRENIYLNGTILGMTRVEIKQKFDEIVAFAEIEKFLDTPVKRYSSGMYVRLAFAVAAHLEPEILIIDEVLAVGDAQFQKKCLGKMEKVGKEGRTVIFVSHNMGAIKRLCNRSLLLREGILDLDGASEHVINNYLSGGHCDSVLEKYWLQEEAPGDDSLILKAVRVFSSEEKHTYELRIEEPIIIEIEVSILKNLPEAFFSIYIINSDGVIVLHTSDIMNGQNAERKSGVLKLQCKIPAYSLNTGKYSLNVASDIPFKKIVFHEKDILTWEVLDTCEKMGRYGVGNWKGILGPGIAQWSSMEISGRI